MAVQGGVVRAVAVLEVFPAPVAVLGGGDRARHSHAGVLRATRPCVR